MRNKCFLSVLSVWLLTTYAFGSSSTSSLFTHRPDESKSANVDEVKEVQKNQEESTPILGAYPSPKLQIPHNPPKLLTPSPHVSTMGQPMLPMIQPMPSFPPDSRLFLVSMQQQLCWKDATIEAQSRVITDLRKDLEHIQKVNIECATTIAELKCQLQFIRNEFAKKNVLLEDDKKEKNAHAEETKTNKEKLEKEEKNGIALQLELEKMRKENETLEMELKNKEEKNRLLQSSIKQKEDEISKFQDEIKLRVEAEVERRIESIKRHFLTIADTERKKNELEKMKMQMENIALKRKLRDLSAKHFDVPMLVDKSIYELQILHSHLNTCASMLSEQFDIVSNEISGIYARLQQVRKKESRPVNYRRSKSNPR